MAAVLGYKVDCPVCHEALCVPLHVTSPHLRVAGAKHVTVAISPDGEYLRSHFADHPHGGGEPILAAA